MYLQADNLVDMVLMSFLLFFDNIQPMNIVF